MLNWVFLATGYISQMVYLIYWDVLVFFIIFPEKIWISLFNLEIYKDWLYLQPHYSLQIWEK